MSSAGRVKLYSVLLCFGAMLSLNATVSYAAGFATNFQPTYSNWSSGNTLGYCGFNICPSGHDSGNGDPTPFEESFVVVNGVRYIHVLVGDPASGFASESYTRWGAGPNTTDPTIIPDLGGVFSPDGGGNETTVIGNVPGFNGTTGLNYLHDNLNMGNPLADSHISGTGANAPTNTVFRMVLSCVGTTACPVDAGNIAMEVSKPFLDKKPRISQTVESGSMTAVFVTDMRALSYSDISTPAPIVNNVVIDDPGIPGTGAGDFEMAMAQATNITSGRFTYTPGSGWNTANGWIVNGSSFGQGTYSYIESTGFQPTTFDYKTVFDYAQNATACSVDPDNNGVSNGVDHVARQEAGGTVGGGPGVGQTSCPGHP